MWGFQDRGLILREELHKAITSANILSAAYQRRWRHETHKSNLCFELELTEEEWGKEWDLNVHLASAQPRGYHRYDL